MINWDFSKLSTVKYEENTYEFDGQVKDISVKTDTANVELLPSEEDGISVLCYEEKNARHTVTTEDGVLKIELCDERKWYEHIGINFGTPKITVKLPQGEYGEMKIKLSTGDTVVPDSFSFESVDISGSTGDVAFNADALGDVRIKVSTGNISVEDISTKSMDLSVSTGHITVTNAVCNEQISVKVSTGKAKISDVSCQSFVSEGSTGDIYLGGVIASEKLSVERSTGDVAFDGCDGGEIRVKTDTGDVTGTLLSEKVFFANTDTGNVDVPKSIDGGKCEITTSTGDIEIKVIS